MVRFGKIVLKGAGEGVIADRAAVFLGIQKELKVPLTGLKPIKSGYLAMTETEQDVDKLLTVKAGETLAKLGLQTSVPPKVRAQRSIICRQVDSYVGEHTKEQLLGEINRCNGTIRAVEVIKFKDYTHVFKVELENTQMADKVATNGLLCFHVKISPTQIEREEYVDIMVCFQLLQVG